LFGNYGSRIGSKNLEKGPQLFISSQENDMDDNKAKYSNVDKFF